MKFLELIIFNENNTPQCVAKRYKDADFQIKLILIYIYIISNSTKYVSVII